jgi:hypothetical protein
VSYVSLVFIAFFLLIFVYALFLPRLFRLTGDSVSLFALAVADVICWVWDFFLDLKRGVCRFCLVVRIGW